ncbi:MAG: hypothetical protein WC799_25375 [Desulfobacteraceae bacterium]|jgi:hypothetical protein
MTNQTLQKQKEQKILSYFLDMYEKLTSKSFQIIESSERPDFLLSDENNNTLGLELTQIRRGHPEEYDWDTIIEKRTYMRLEDALEMLQEIVEKKEQKRREPDWNFPKNSILLVEFSDIPLNNILNYINEERLPDIYSSGFSEIWLIDLSGIEVFGDIELFCVKPACYEGYYPREFQKPFG